MSKIIFLTGANGFVGSSLIARILKEESDSRLVALVRGSSNLEAEQRLWKTLGTIHSGFDVPQVRSRIQVVQGDLTCERFGLVDSLYHTLTENITHIIHSAASVQFDLPLEDARRINVEGTKNMMTFAHRAIRVGKLQRIAYISTAYASGDRSGLIYEDELACGQRFSNIYEQTKFEAESYVSGLMGQLPITIFRPSIIVGDSNTGRTTAFNVLYFPLKLIYQGLLKILPGAPTNPLDIVPVDYVCNAICQIFFHSNTAVGRTFHLTSGGTPSSTTGEVVDLAVDYFNESALDFSISPITFLPLELFRKAHKIVRGGVKRILQAMELYVPYLCVARVFDTRNTSADLRGTNITPPPFSRYYQTILGYCLKTDWGKRIKLVV